MKTTIEWHKCSEKLPEKSGQYWHWYTSTAIMDLPFSVKHQRWNVRDHDDMDAEAVNCNSMKIEGHVLWAEIPDILTYEKENQG